VWAWWGSSADGACETLGAFITLGAFDTFGALDTFDTSGAFGASETFDTLGVFGTLDTFRECIIRYPAAMCYLGGSMRLKPPRGDELRLMGS
jgi:hypothetical protein